MPQSDLRLTIRMARLECKRSGFSYPAGFCGGLRSDVMRFRVLRRMRIELAHLTPLQRDALLEEATACDS